MSVNKATGNVVLPAVPDLGRGDPRLGADGVLAVGGDLDDDEGRHRAGQLPPHEADAEALHVLVEAGRGAQAVPADHGVRPGLRWRNLGYALLLRLKLNAAGDISKLSVMLPIFPNFVASITMSESTMVSKKLGCKNASLWSCSLPD